MMKKRLLLLSMVLLPMLASAVSEDSVEVDGRYYRLIPKGNVAEIIGMPQSYYDEKTEDWVVFKPYSGDFVIPDEFEYNDVKYKVTTIGSNAFSNSTSLTSITIPNSIKTIEQGAFQNCSQLTSVKILDLSAWCNIELKGFKSSPLQIAHTLYLNDEELHDLVIPDGVKTINTDVFNGCTSLTSVTIPKSVTYIGYQAFSDCTSLTTVTIGDNESEVANTVIDCRAFYKCSELESVSLGNNIVEIGGDAFYQCTSLPSIVIPNSVTNINGGSKGKFCTFSGCTSLSSVQLSENITSLAQGTFYNCTSLTSISIPEKVEKIDGLAFADCINLSDIKLPSNLITVDQCTFENCKSLEAISIPDKVSTIQKGAFLGCSNLKEVTLGRGITDLYQGSFENCAKLETVYCYADVPPTCHNEYNSYFGRSNGPFENSYVEYATLYVPKTSIDGYKSAALWNNFGTIAELDDIETPQCATPTIAFKNGKLSFDCETEGVSFVYSFMSSFADKMEGNNVELPSTYTVSVYAKKAGYLDSETVTKTIDVRGIKGDMNDDGVLSVTDVGALITKILSGE